MFVRTAQGWPAACSARNGIGGARDGRAGREQNPVEVEHDAGRRHALAGGVAAVALRPSSGGQLVEPADALAGVVRVAPVAIDEYRAEAAAGRAGDVVVDAVADHDRRLGRRAAERERGGEDRGAGLAAAVCARREREIHADPELCRERPELAIGVGDEPDRAARCAQDLEQRLHVGKQLEVARIAQASSAAIPICSASALRAPMPRTISTAKRRC